MAAYETPEQAANFLAGIHLDILNTGKGDFSPNHVKYTCQLTPRYGDPFTTDYQSNPSVHGEPTVTQVVSSLLSDSRIPDAYHDVDDFADDMGYRKPSAAIRACDQTKGKTACAADETSAKRAPYVRPACDTTPTRHGKNFG